MVQILIALFILYIIYRLVSGFFRKITKGFKRSTSDSLAFQDPQLVKANSSPVSIESIGENKSTFSNDEYTSKSALSDVFQEIESHESGVQEERKSFEDTFNDIFSRNYDDWPYGSNRVLFPKKN